MPTRKPTPHQPLALQMTELAWAVPQVIAHRVTRMALAGAKPNARDRREFNRMSAEKTAAFTASWVAMTTQALAAQQEFALGLLRGQAWPWGASGDWASAATSVLGHGLAPVHRVAVANAKRLLTTRLK